MFFSLVNNINIPLKKGVNNLKINSNFKKNNIKYLNILLKLLLIVFLIISYSYFTIIENISDEYVIFEGETISVNTSFGLSLDEQNISTNTKTFELNLFDSFLIKDVNVSVLPVTTVIPCGNIAGLKLYTNGILVVGMSEITDSNNIKYAPYENSGIVEGDSIISVNDIIVTSTTDFISLINNSKGTDIELEYVHNEEVFVCSITPIETSTGDYKVRIMG